MERTGRGDPAHPDDRLRHELKASVFLMSAAVGVLLVVSLLGSAIS